MNMMDIPVSWKKFWIAVAVLLLSAWLVGVCLTLAGRVGAETLMGDADCSGVVDARDGLAILQLDAGLRGTRGICTDAADVNRDGRITPVDALLVLQYSAGIIPSLSLSLGIPV